MNRDDIIRMAREAGMELYGDDLLTTNHGYRPVDVNTLTKFAALVAAAEREECAEVAEAVFEDKKQDDTYWGIPEVVEAIRARGQQ